VKKEKPKRKGGFVNRIKVPEKEGRKKGEKKKREWWNNNKLRKKD